MKNEKDLQSQEIGEELDDDMLDSVAGGVTSHPYAGKKGNPPEAGCMWFTPMGLSQFHKETWRFEVSVESGDLSCVHCTYLKRANGGYTCKYCY